MYCSRSWLAEFHAIFPCAKTLAFSIHFRMDSSISLYSSKCEDAWKVSSTQMNVNPFWRVGNSSLTCVFGYSHPREWPLSLWHWKGSWKVTCLWKICQKFPSALRVINQVHNTFISLFLTLHSHLILFTPFYHLFPSHWVKKVASRDCILQDLNTNSQAGYHSKYSVCYPSLEGRGRGREDQEIKVLIGCEWFEASLAYMKKKILRKSWTALNLRWCIYGYVCNFKIFRSILNCFYRTH